MLWVIVYIFDLIFWSLTWLKQKKRQGLWIKSLKTSIYSTLLDSIRLSQSSSLQRQKRESQWSTKSIMTRDRIDLLLITLRRIDYNWFRWDSLILLKHYLSRSDPEAFPDSFDSLTAFDLCRRQLLEFTWSKYTLQSQTEIDSILSFQWKSSLRVIHTRLQDWKIISNTSVQKPPTTADPDSAALVLRYLISHDSRPRSITYWLTTIDYLTPQQYTAWPRIPSSYLTAIWSIQLSLIYLWSSITVL